MYMCVTVAGVGEGAGGRTRTERRGVGEKEDEWSLYKYLEHREPSNAPRLLCGGGRRGARGRPGHGER